MAKAIDVLSEYYGSSFVQVTSLSFNFAKLGLRIAARDSVAEYFRLKSLSPREVSAKQPEFGGAKGDVGSTIVSVLEVRPEGLKDVFKL